MVECMVFMQNMVLQGLLLLLQAAIGQMRAFVAIIIFVEYGFFVQTFTRRHLGFDSDFAAEASACKRAMPKCLR